MMFRVRGLIGMYEYDRVAPPGFSFWFTLKGSVAPLLWTPSPAISGYLERAQFLRAAQEAFLLSLVSL